MHGQPGVFIVLEGADGSGKTTQFRLTVERLKAVGHEVEVFKFPQYDQPSSSFVKSYLNGEYGPASEVSPYTASMFYALDRYHASPRIKKALDEGKIVIADRYVGSNMAHQGSKFSNFAQQRGFFIWGDSLEFELLGIPRPNINIFLRVPIEISLGLMGDRSKRTYTDKKLDQHEADDQHLQKTVATYDLLCKLFPKDFKEIDCAPDGQLLGIVQINDQIWEALKPLLPHPRGEARGATVKLRDQPGQDESRQPRKKSKSAKKTQDHSDTIDFSSLPQDLRKSYYKVQAQITELQQKMKQVKDIDKPVIESAIELSTTLLADWLWLNTLLPKPKGRPGQPDDEPTAIHKILDEITTSQARPAGREIELKLVEVKPRNELELLDQDRTDNLTYQQKHIDLERRLTKDFSKLSYSLSATISYHLFKRLLDDNLIDHPQTTHPSALIGYELSPQIAESAQLDELFNRCFGLSSELYNRLLTGGFTDLAPQVLLRGHLNRWRFKLNIDKLAEALAKEKVATDREVLERLAGLIGEVHPIVAKALLGGRAINNPKLKKARSNG